MPETIKLNATQSFIMKITSKRKLQQIESSYSSDIDSKNSIIIYKNFTKEPYLLLMNYTTLSSDNPLQFRKKLL